MKMKEGKGWRKMKSREEGMEGMKREVKGWGGIDGRSEEEDGKKLTR